MRYELSTVVEIFTQVPLPHCVSGVAKTFQFLGQRGQVQPQSCRLEDLQSSLTQYWGTFVWCTLLPEWSTLIGRDCRDRVLIGHLCHKDHSDYHDIKDIMTNLLQYCLLSPNVERIFPGEKSRPRGSADLLTVGLLQPHPS